MQCANDVQAFVPSEESACLVVEYDVLFEEINGILWLYVRLCYHFEGTKNNSIWINMYKAEMRARVRVCVCVCVCVTLVIALIRK